MSTAIACPVGLSRPSLVALLLAGMLLVPAASGQAGAHDPDPPKPGMDLALGLLASPGAPADDEPQPDEPPPDLFAPRGLAVHEAGVAPGYVLVAPLSSTSTYLIDNQGEIVHEWPSAFGPGAAYLMGDGTLLRCARLDDPPFFHGGGIYGRLERLGPDGTVLWTYDQADEQRMIHHDVELLPNGNILFIAWDRMDGRDALKHGRHPAATHETEGLWPDMLFELRPNLPQGGEIVWQWRMADHLVQDLDPRSQDHGDVTASPGRFDMNGEHRDQAALSAEEIARLDALDDQMRALGYVGGDDTDEDKDRRKKPDWFHTNAVDHHAGLDLIVISSPRWSELYVIDHSTSTEQARGSSGGRWGRGGEVLWRWGHPRRHGAGTDDDRQLFYQHDPQWLDGSNAGAASGQEGAARADGLRLTVFNNGGDRPGGDRSSVDELLLPFDPASGFLVEAGQPHGPDAPAWSYEDAPTFFSPFISGAQRLPNGNTLICQGAAGRIFEVTRDGQIVWEWRNDKGGELPPPKGVSFVPPFALFRATRYAPDHPGVVALLGKG